MSEAVIQKVEESVALVADKEKKKECASDNMEKDIKRKKVEKLSECFISKGMEINRSFNFSSFLLKDITTEEAADSFIKQFSSSSNYSNSFTGLTSKAGQTKHTHEYVIMLLNFSKSLVGVTISTEGTDNHIHTINIPIDGNRMVSLEGYTEYQGQTDEDADGVTTYNDIHRHVFSADIETIKDEVDSIYISSMYFNESGEFVKRQEIPEQNAVKQEKDIFAFTDKRQAEIALLKLAHSQDSNIQQKVYYEIEEKYDGLTVEDDSFVAEMLINLASKTDPNAKVRNRGDAICPSTDPNVTDKKDHFPQNCLSGDTKIALLDGTEKPIAELVGKEVWIYAYDTKRKAVVPAFANNIRKTGINAEVIKITLDNGKEIVCTPHHPIMLRNGEYKLAGNLQESESLMPIHLSIWGQPENYPKFIKNGYYSFYNQIYQPFYKRWETVHEVVARDFNNLGDNPTYVVHHNDKNKLNNLPSNLIIMEKKDHNRLHGLEKFNDPEFKAKRKEYMKKASIALWSNPEHRIRQSMIMKIENKKRNLDPLYHQRLSVGVKKGVINSRLLRDNKTLSEEMAMYENAIKTTPYFKDAAKSLNMHVNTLRRRMRSLGLLPDKIPVIEKNINIDSDDFNKNKEYYTNLMKQYLTIKEAAKYLGIHEQTLSRKLHFYGVYLSKTMPNNVLIDNHKVVKIEKFNNCDVYDLEVPEYHNFGLSSGIFVHNSVSQARNALARVAQYSKSPSWWKGSLSALQKKVRSAVKAKYPSVKVTMNEFYALRFKENDTVFFMDIPSEDIDDVKRDASIYFKACPNMEISIVKFSVDDNEKTNFIDLGRVVLFDNTKRIDFDSCSEEIKLSSTDTKGNVVVEILREGKFNHEIYGTLNIDRNMLNTLVKNFNAGILDRDVSFDFNHMPELPAAAWVKQLSISKRNIKGEQRNVLNAHVNLTPIGKQAIENQEFKYFSAEYVDDFKDKETGKSFGTTLKGGGFTNRPWIPGMAPVQLTEIGNNVALMSYKL